MIILSRFCLINFHLRAITNVDIVLTGRYDVSHSRLQPPGFLPPTAGVQVRLWLQDGGLMPHGQRHGHGESAWELQIDAE